MFYPKFEIFSGDFIPTDNSLLQNEDVGIRNNNELGKDRDRNVLDENTVATNESSLVETVQTRDIHGCNDSTSENMSTIGKWC